MKILDRYILTTYLKTFLSVFIILMLIFVLQAIWLYISELAGKDLDIDVVFKFLLYVTPTLIPLILPLTILLTSIMVFGNFAENYEFAAMKSTGISLQRAMRSLSVFIIGLSVVTFFFANNAIPWANYNFYNLRKNIAQVKPAMAIAEGQFNEIGNINIKVEEKSGDKGQYLKNVVMHQRKGNRPGNNTVIVAESGELIGNENSNILQLILYNGNYYEEIFTKNPRDFQKKPHAKSSFEKYTLNIDLEALDNVDLEDKSSTDRFNMLNTSDLIKTINGLNEDRTLDLKGFSETLYTRTSISTLNNYLEPKKDTIYNGNIIDLFETKTKIQLLNLALNTTTSTSQIIETKKQSLAVNTKWLNKHIISLHEKYALGFACIILFFVGAPLGALIRKGGIGLPLVIAILLFLTYHFIGIFVKNSSQDGSVNPIFATWLSTLIMLPLSIYLTSRATKDRGLLEFDSYFEPIKKFLKLKPKTLLDAQGNVLNFNVFENFKDDKLIDIIKNYKQYNYDVRSKSVAFNLLVQRGVTIDEIQTQGIVIKAEHNQSDKIAKDSIDYSKYTMIFYCIGVILLVLFLVFRNNKLPELAIASRDLSIISLGIYLLYFIVTNLKIKQFYNTLSIKVKQVSIFLMILGFPFYAITHFFLKNKLKEDLDSSIIENVK
ncbi:LptF/LptG family permease [Aquaticitalea lipolytica]|nr:LptF/LptG family permease [Aquaticitalea lipolytica]